MTEKLFKDQGGFGVLAVLLVVVALVGVGAVGYVVYGDNNKTELAPAPKASPTASTQLDDQYAGWKTYTSATAGYSIKYPSDWTLRTVSGNYDSTFITSPEQFEIRLDSFAKNSAYGTNTFTANPTGQCGATCLSSTKVSTLDVPHLGNLQMDVQVMGAGGGSINALNLYLSSGSAYLQSPSMPAIYTAISGFYQGRTQQVNTNEPPSTFMNSASVITAEQIYKSLAY